MPTYQYVCTDCREPLEAVQGFTDDALTTCPACDGKLRKVFSAVGVVFKGSGFYRTDSRSSGADTSSESSSESKDSGSGDSSSGSSSSSDSGSSSGSGSSSSDSKNSSDSKKPKTKAPATSGSAA